MLGSRSWWIIIHPDSWLQEVSGAYSLEVLISGGPFDLERQIRMARRFQAGPAGF